MTAFKEKLKQQGYQVTSQRREIYRFLLETDFYPTAEDIYQSLKGKFSVMSLSTVYRTLQLFIEMDLIRPIHFSRTPTRYDGKRKQHVNLICVRCESVFILEGSSLTTLHYGTPEENYQMLKHRHDIYGLCPRCQSGTMDPI